jgi:hypothetical protein
MVIGRDRQSASSWSPGDKAEVYPVLQSIDEFRAEAEAVAAAGESVSVPDTLDVYAYARAAAVALTIMRPAPRVQHRSGCRCSGRGRQTLLVKAYACDDGLWVWVRGTRIPDAARRSTTPLDEAETAWPVHRFAALQPWVTRCPVCRRYWAVLLRPNGYRLVELGEPRFLAEVTG